MQGLKLGLMGWRFLSFIHPARRCTAGGAGPPPPLPTSVYHHRPPPELSLSGVRHGTTTTSSRTIITAIHPYADADAYAEQSHRLAPPPHGPREVTRVSFLSSRGLDWICDSPWESDTSFCFNPRRWPLFSASVKLNKQRSFFCSLFPRRPTKESRQQLPDPSNEWKGKKNENVTAKKKARWKTTIPYQNCL